MLGACVYCGGEPKTRDHVPSRALLDEPYPTDLPVVDCCKKCNAGFSLDEEYLACFIDCVIAGSTTPSDVGRPKVARILAASESLASRIAKSESNGTGQQLWEPEVPRICNIVLKLARGHTAFELSLPRIDEPLSVAFAPLAEMSDVDVEHFLKPVETTLWPELGSRAFIQAVKRPIDHTKDHWNVVQPGRYQYLVSQAEGLIVRILISDYLACEVRWD